MPLAVVLPTILSEDLPFRDSKVCTDWRCANEYVTLIGLIQGISPTYSETILYFQGKYFYPLEAFVALLV